jgi:hypothetical protein
MRTLPRDRRKTTTMTRTTRRRAPREVRSSARQRFSQSPDPTMMRMTVGAASHTTLLDRHAQSNRCPPLDGYT